MEFDTGLHYVGGLDEGQSLHDAFKTLGLLDLPWQRLDKDGFDQITIGRQTFPLAEGFDHFADVLSDYFPQERAALQQFTAMLRDLPPMEECSQVNAYDYLTSLFHDPLLVHIVSAAAMKMELRRESLPLFTFAHGLSGYIQSSWRLKGSGNLIVNSLIKDIEAAGGEIRCDSEVCELFFRRIGMLENTFGMFTVSLVLKPDVLPYFNHNKYVYRKANVWTFHEEGDGIGGVMVSARVPENNSRYVRQIDLLTPLPWSLCETWENTVVGRRGEPYEQQKEQWAAECIRLAENVLPGLSDMIEKRYTSTPLTWRDYTLSPCGSAFGVRKDCRMPLMTMLSSKTPVSNLFLTGQSLMLHGLEGVTKMAFNTLETINNTKIL